MTEEPLPFRYLRKGDLIRIRMPRQREPRIDPEKLEILRRIREAEIREYLKRRRAS